MISQKMKEAANREYEKAMTAYPAKKKETDEFLKGKNGDEACCLHFIYAYMHVNDMVSYSPDTMDSYVRASLKMREEIPYAVQVPEELFLTYVLCPRVNNENLDQSRSWLYDQLKDRVKDKSMTDAAIEVNYWCYEKATYISSDSRTISPLTMCRSARGRCGEESTLAVSAMRSVGIPARQCYVPRWAHCDDNHAWVEVWTDGKWHYLGACEPEPVLDRGWFTAAASKAMLVHSKAYSHFLGGEKAAYQTPLYSLMNATPSYAKCAAFRARVLDHGIPVKGIHVAFQLINYSELFELYGSETDEEGWTEFVTGLGDLYLSVTDGKRFLGRKADVRLEKEAVLDLKDAVLLDRLDGVWEERFDLIPPKETVGEMMPEGQKKLHKDRLCRCEKIRSDYEASFVTDQEGEWNPYFRHARGNREEIRKFRENEDFAEEDKKKLLDTLREKDFMDVTAELLAGFLKNALKYRGKDSEEIFWKYLAAPRIADEMLVDCRAEICGIIRSRGKLPQTAGEVWNYLEKHVRVMDDYGAGNFLPDAAGCLRYAMAPERAFPFLFVQICRSLGIPARLNPVDRTPEYVTEKTASEPVFLKVSDEKKEEKAGKVCLTLVNREKEPIPYELKFTIAKFAKESFQTLCYEQLAVDDRCTLCLEPGCYRLLTALRQIDGSVSAVAKMFDLKKDLTLELEMGKDETKEKLLSVEILSCAVRLRKDSAYGEEKKLEDLIAGRNSIFLHAEAGKEPTEHLMQELLECRDLYREENCRVVLSAADPECFSNETVSRVLKSGIDAVPVICTDERFLHQLHKNFGVGDERLPFAAAVGKNGKGLAAFVNYNIGTAWTLISVLKASEEN